MNRINYIKTYTKKIIINGSVVINMNLKEYLDNILLDQLTTYEGRKNAIKKRYAIYKLTPIYVNNMLMLFPINNLKDYENIYINVYNIKSLGKIKKQTMIEFIDNTKILINKNTKIIDNYIKRIISINHNS